MENPAFYEVAAAQRLYVSRYFVALQELSCGREGMSAPFVKGMF
jgi:hypothetical protein